MPATNLKWAFPEPRRGAGPHPHALGEPVLSGGQPRPSRSGLRRAQRPSLERVFAVPSQPGLRGGHEHLVLWLGRIGNQRGLAHLLDAAGELVHRRGRRNVTLAIVGDGDARPALVEEVHRRGLDDCVAVPGLAGSELVRAYLATADVCVSMEERPRFNDLAWASKVLEYMAAGRAVVQFPVREVQRLSGDTTVYARNGDPLDFAEKVSELLVDRAERERLGAAARARVLDGLTSDDQVPTLLAAVEAALSVAGQRGAPQ